ncbi:hypothetical protein [Exiguobacterium mexicanum]|uniref:hypothetical protein n=1 Tax=Exiguobacterium mexicanum TaxID=340146 RepID=UPI0037C11E6F
MTEWEYAKRIIETINDHGGEAYIVGGAVRDYMRGTLPDDIDIATSLFPDEVMRLFPKSVPTGIDHGTVTVILDHHPFEVTTFRSEGTYSDSRRPDHVSLGVSLEEDMKRRDFTMNAMAFHDGNVIDLFGDGWTSRHVSSAPSAARMNASTRMRSVSCGRSASWPSSISGSTTTCNGPRASSATN